MKTQHTNLNFIRPLLKVILIISSAFFLLPSDVQATHIVGGDLTYQCLGNNQYRIRLTVRRDCLLGADDAPFDNPASIGLFDPVTFQRLEMLGFPQGQFLIHFDASDTLNEILHSDCSVVMGDVCVHTTVYDTVIILPFRAGGYTFVYQRCCRNESLNNVMDPLETGMTLVAELSGSAQLECNSSPRFGPYPPIYTCVNKELIFDHSAIDLEGDSLVYELCTPLTGATMSHPKPQPPNPGPYGPITFRAPYSLANVMGGVPLQIDPNTGLLTGTPNTIGQFVVGICVTAYKNGVMTGRTRRDFQFNVRQCRDVPTPLFTAPSLTCDSLTVQFANQSTLADEYLWIFNFGDTTNMLTDTAFEPSFTFPEGGFYNVALVVNVLEAGGRFCYDTLVQTIGVFDSQVNAEFTYDVTSCTDSIMLQITDQSVDPDINHDVVDWDWVVTVGGNVFVSGEPNPKFTFYVEGCETILVALQVTSSNGCTATQVHSFPVCQISIAVDPDSEHLCRGDTTHLLIGANSDFTYLWDPTTGLDLGTNGPHDPLAYPGLDVTYCVTVTDGLCEVVECIPVEVQQLPTLDFEYETDCRSLDVVFDNNSVNGINFQWNFGTGNPGDTSILENPTFTFPDSGEYIVTLSSRDGCDVSVRDTVTANAITEDLDDSATNCFKDSIHLNPDFDSTYIYVWSDPNLTGPNPFVSVADDTEFYVTISSPGLPGCEIVDSITVVIPDDFSVNAGEDTVSCVLTDIVLNATLNTTSQGDFDFVWTNEAGDTISLLSSVSVAPDTTQQYTVVVTDSLGCSMSDVVQVTRQDPAFKVLATPETDTFYCNIQTITLTGSSTLPVGDVTFIWINTMTGDTISDVSVVDVTPGSGPAIFELIGTEVESGCQDSEIVVLNPTFFNLSITDDQSICLEESVGLSVVDHNNQNLDYLWSTGATTSDITVSPTDTTQYCVTVTNTDVGCVDTLCTTVVVNLFDPFDVVISYTPIPPIVALPITVSVNQPAHFNYVWSSNPPIAGLPNANEFIVVYPADPTTFSVTVTNDAGCTQEASISVPGEDIACDATDIGIPNVFTPNGDGQNDEFRVLSNFVSTIDLHIYNRWGQEVFKTTNPGMGWDGTFNGKRLPPDVYGYYVSIGCPNQKEYFTKGNITLLE